MSALSSGIKSFSVGMCFLGQIKRCTGACGRRSLNATRRSSSCTNSAGVSCPMIRQKRQACCMSVNLTLVALALCTTFTAAVRRRHGSIDAWLFHAVSHRSDSFDVSRTLGIVPELLSERGHMHIDRAVKHLKIAVGVAYSGPGIPEDLEPRIARESLGLPSAQSVKSAAENVCYDDSLCKDSSSSHYCC